MSEIDSETIITKNSSQELTSEIDSEQTLSTAHDIGRSRTHVMSELTHSINDFSITPTTARERVMQVPKRKSYIGKTIYKCPRCDYQVSSKSSYETHLLRKSPCDSRIQDEKYFMKTIIEEIPILIEKIKADKSIKNSLKLKKHFKILVQFKNEEFMPIEEMIEYIKEIDKFLSNK